MPPEKFIIGSAKGWSIDKALKNALEKVSGSNLPSGYLILEIRVSTGGVVGPMTTVKLEPTEDSP